ncbi:MAG: hypothetical protein IK095_00090 [Oscillospiraceae bacterium]|nr:hypothetical protein [Oscillospiraceae bacterium]
MSKEIKITLRDMMEEASNEFDRATNGMQEVLKKLEIRVGGRDRSALVGSVAGAICWAVAFLVIFLFARPYLDLRLGLIALCFAEALAIALLVDAIVKLGFFGKLLGYRSEIERLESQVDHARTALAADLSEFEGQRAKGWSMPLRPGQSVLVRSREIEEEVKSIEDLSTGFLKGLKNVFYYLAALGIAGVGGFALFDLADRLVDVSYGWYVAALAVACIAEIIAAKWVWGKTKCEVNNVTVFVTLLGPVLFAAVIAAVALALLALGVIIAIAVIGVVFSMSSGG